MTAAERDALILSLEPAVKSVARQRHRSLSFLGFDEVLSAAWLGAIQAVDHFDASKGFLLTTYARWKISSAISDYLRSLDPVSRDQLRRIRADPTAEVPRTFSIHRLDSDSRDFDIGDNRSFRPFHAVEARLDLATICNADHKVKPRALRIVTSYANGASMKEISAREGVNESRISQICSRTYRLLRAAA